MPNQQCNAVHVVGPDSPWVECRVTGDRTFRIRISNVRAIARTIDDDAPDFVRAPSAKTRI